MKNTNIMRLSNKEYNDLKKFIYEYPTKYEMGFIHSEQLDVIQKLKEKYKSFNEDKYNKAQNGITCVMSEDGFVIYHSDVFNSAVCAIENRGLNLEEWD